MSLLRVENLSKSFGGVKAVADVSFAVEPGAIHSLIGPNGAGKTTLFNLVTGVYAPTAGRIHVGGRDVTGFSTAARAALGVQRTFQNLQIFFNMTAIENVMVGRHLHVGTGLVASLLGLPGIVHQTADARAKAEALMVHVGLGDWLGADADAMPYGALKRLEIARALAAEPRLLLLDEPAAGLNPRETQEIERLIRRVAASGVTVVLVEHDMKLVMNVSDHILVLDYGRKLAEGTADEVRRNPEVIKAYLGEAAAGETGGRGV
ncbi:MAG: ABC transporter ATP-binding protein [Rhodospirillales bacterium]|nr:ABC transporter ATP-binding protein [Rhodospirillales bacterium]